MAIADKQDAEGIRDSAAEIEQLIAREAERGVAPESIVIATARSGSSAPARSAPTTRDKGSTV